MIAVSQTSFGNNEGNCWAACLATILEMPLESIPDFRGPEQFDATLAWLWGRKMTMVELNFRPRIKPPLWFERFGLKGTGLAIAGGKSPRGDFDHAIVIAVDHVAQKVEFVHDPHPSGAWLEDLDSLAFIMPVLLKRTPRYVALD